MARPISDDDDKKLAIMRSLSIFTPFSDDELLIILDNSRWLKCDSGDMIVKEGDTDNNFFIILKGSVRVQKRIGGSGMKKPISSLKKGQSFGEMSVITGQPRSADVVAEEDTFVLKIDSNTLDMETESFELRSIQFKFYKIFCEILSHRLVSTNILAIKPA